VAGRWQNGSSSEQRQRRWEAGKAGQPAGSFNVACHTVLDPENRVGCHHVCSAHHVRWLECRRSLLLKYELLPVMVLPFYGGLRQSVDNNTSVTKSIPGRAIVTTHACRYRHYDEQKYRSPSSHRHHRRRHNYVGELRPIEPSSQHVTRICRCIARHHPSPFNHHVRVRELVQYVIRNTKWCSQVAEGVEGCGSNGVAVGGERHIR